MQKKSLNCYFLIRFLEFIILLLSIFVFHLVNSWPFWPWPNDPNCYDKQASAKDVNDLLWKVKVQGVKHWNVVFEMAPVTITHLQCLLCIAYYNIDLCLCLCVQAWNDQKWYALNCDLEVSIWSRNSNSGGYLKKEIAYSAFL